MSEELLPKISALPVATPTPSGLHIPRTVADCNTLAQFRYFVLRASQDEIATRGNLVQQQISSVERGKLPRPKSWPRYLRAYGTEAGPLGEADFLRLFSGGTEQTNA